MVSNRVSSFLLGAYTVFFYLFWIERDRIGAFVFLSVIVALSFFVKKLKFNIPLVLTLGLTHAVLQLERFVNYMDWPVDFYLATIVGLLFFKYVLKKPLSLGGWSFRFSRQQWLSIFCINIPAISILFWYFQNHKEVAKQFPLPELAPWSVPFVVVFIAAINGLREEVYFRGLLQNQTQKDFPAWFVLGFQAISFGAIHFLNGFPQGWLGVAMTGVWGLAIAFQYRFFKSLSLAWVTHAIADAIMFSIIILNK